MLEVSVVTITFVVTWTWIQIIALESGIRLPTWQDEELFCSLQGVHFLK